RERELQHDPQHGEAPRHGDQRENGRIDGKQSHGQVVFAFHQRSSQLRRERERHGFEEPRQQRKQSERGNLAAPTTDDEVQPSAQRRAASRTASVCSWRANHAAPTSPAASARRRPGPASQYAATPAPNHRNVPSGETSSVGPTNALAVKATNTASTATRYVRSSTSLIARSLRSGSSRTLIDRPTHRSNPGTPVSSTSKLNVPAPPAPFPSMRTFCLPPKPDAAPTVPRPAPKGAPRISRGTCFSSAALALVSPAPSTRRVRCDWRARTPFPDTPMSAHATPAANATAAMTTNRGRAGPK